MDTKFLNTFLRGILLLALLFLLTSSLPGNTFPALAAPGDIRRVSVDSSGTQADKSSTKPAISDDGRYVAFQSSATNLISGDTNNTDDIFVHDRQTGAITRVSVRSNGNQANGGSSSPAISADGRFVAFYSDANNLLNGDTNGCGDIFVHDRQTGQTTRVSVDSKGNEENAPPPDDYAVVSISGDGRYVTFYSDATNLVSGDTNGVTDIFVHDRQTGQTVRASVASDGAQANAWSSHPNLSSDGRYVAFDSGATNLVAGDTNDKRDVFVRDLQAGTTKRVSVNSRGEQADRGGTDPDISGDGRFVVFLSSSDNLDPREEDVSGKYLVYVHDRQGGQTILASVYSEGWVLEIGIINQAIISRNGRYVAFDFHSHGAVWAATVVHDLLTGTSVYAPEASIWLALSADGSLVAFSSGASNLVSGDTNNASDIFVKEVSYGPDRNPTVNSITPDCGFSPYPCPHPTPASVSFLVLFSEQVTGVTADDFSLTMREGVSGASISGVSGYGSQYFVSVDTGTGDGTLYLQLVDDDSIVDSALNPLGGPGAGNGNKSSTAYYIDRGVPTVTSILRADPSPTAADTVNFTVSFSEQVWPVRPSSFVLSTTGNISGASVTTISPREDEYKSVTTYTVTVNTGTGDGTLRLDLIDDDSILDQMNNPLGGAGAGNGNFSSGEVYTIVKSTPIVPTVTSSLRSDPNPSAADMVSFTVTFSEGVSGVDPSDFTLITTGSLSGALVANVSGSGNTYTVIVGTGTGDGGLRLDLIDDDSILTASGIPLGGLGAGNGNFNTGEAYTVDKTVPLVTGSLRADANPTTANSVNFTVVFSEAVSGVDASDFFLSTTGNLAGTAITGVNGSGYLYTVTASTGSGDGTLRLDILDDDSIMDVVGHPLGGTGLGNGNFTTGEEYTFNRAPVNKITETYRSNGNNDGWVLESSENSNKGGSLNAKNNTCVLGDDKKNRQFRVILDFPTYYLPDNAAITRVLLMIKKESVLGTDPFNTHQNILVDIRPGGFGYLGPFPYRGLQISDFQSPSSMDSVGMIQNNPLDGWYWTWIDSVAFKYIDLKGFTQFRLRFQIDDNNDSQINQLRFYSGDQVEQTDRPRLVVEYYLSR